ncbi:probable serine/threonine-protein kinase DDB_G0267686 isoform X1, partial [Argonauta hians]
PLRGSLVPKEFLLQLESRSSWRKLPHTATTELKKVFTRAKLFDKLISNSITDLQRIFKDYLNKHCLSFLSEGDPAGLKTPTLYENNIQKWRQEIQNEYTILQCQLAELQDLGISLPHYVDSIDRVTQVMSEVLDFLPHIVDLIKLWLSEEEVYLKKIDDELGSLLRQKARCGKALRRQHSAMQDMRSDYQQQKFIGQRLWQGVKAAMQDKKQLEQQEAGLKNSLNITESELSLMKNSRSDAEMQFQSRHVNKPGPTATSLFEHWTDFIEKQEQDICQLRLRRDRVKVEWSRLIKSKYYCQRKLDEAQSKYQSCKKVLDQIEGKLQKEEEDYLRLERDLEILAAKVGTMERIKEQKIQTHTIETMFTKPKMTTTTTTTTTATAAATTTNTEHEQDFESVFDKVCSLVAAEIGKDWVCLYKILPFRPTRDIRSRMRDIETIEHQCQLAADQGTKDMAYQALHKWKLFSDHSSIRSLTNALQRLNKSEILMMMKKNKYIAAK